MNKSIRTLASTAAFLALTMVPAFAQNSKPAAAPAATPTATPAAAPAKMKATPKATKAAKPAVARHAAWTKDQIKAAQEGLAKGGYYKGEATGIMNKPTQAALRAWQKANKMPANGRLSDEILSKLSS
ncbi:MAG: peptidoglycan-binding domain-containing protein [Candidatus Eisenbacteria bacterium]